MPSHTRTNVSSAVNDIESESGTTVTSTPPFLKLDGYNFAIDKMHSIISQYPLKNEMYLRSTRVPDLNDYLAWKTVSRMALLHKFTVQKAVNEHVKQLHEMQENINDYPQLAPRPSNTTAMPQAGSAELDAAHILTTMSFRSLSAAGTIHPYNFSLASTDANPDQPPSPTFPPTDHLPVPEGSDAFLLNPTLEDAQRRWVKGVNKEDRIKDIVRKDPNGNRYVTQKTIYIVDGEEFHVLPPRRKRGTAASKKSTTASQLGAMSILTAAPVPNKQPRSKKSPLDSGIALDNKFENPSGKRARSDSSNDMPLSSMSRPGKRLRGTSKGPVNSRKASSESNSSSSQISTKDVDNLRAILDPASMSSVMGAFSSTGQPIMAAPTMKPSHSQSQTSTQASASTNDTPRGTRRRAPPAPLNLAPPKPSRQTRATPTPVPMTPTDTPQQSSTATSTPRKNKYVPTTPNPHRWTAAELYHLNGLARRGLHPKDLHPMMMQQFPDRVRSVHAVKDRRDKMARNKELQGRVPNYQARYGNV